MAALNRFAAAQASRFGLHFIDFYAASRSYAHLLEDNVHHAPAYYCAQARLVAAFIRGLGCYRPLPPPDAGPRGPGTAVGAVGPRPRCPRQSSWHGPEIPEKVAARRCRGRFRDVADAGERREKRRTKPPNPTVRPAANGSGLQP